MDMDMNSNKMRERRQFNACVELVQLAGDELKKAKEQANETLEKHRIAASKVNQLMHDVRPILDEISALRKTKWLLQHFDAIRNAHCRLEQDFKTERFTNITESFENLAKPCIELAGFKCNGYDVYGERVLTHWKNELSKRLSSEFEQCFRRVSWPRSPVIKKQNVPVPSPSSLETFKQLVRTLIVVDRARVGPNPYKTTADKICYPMRLMMKPIDKQCLFDFLLSPKTNLLDKPEWYMNLTLKWINENSKFIREVIDPIVGNYAEYLGAFTQFVACMLELVLTRLEEDVSKIVTALNENEHDVECRENFEKLFIHTASELLSFTKEIRTLLGDHEYYQFDENLDLMASFSTDDNFARILDTERTRAREQLSNIINSNTAWSLVLEDIYEDDYRITECVDRLVLLITAISERADCYRRVDCQHRLIELQCDLFIKFIDALHQIDAPDSVSTMLRPSHEVSRLQWKLRDPYFQIMNGVNFIRILFQDRSFLSAYALKNIEPRSKIDTMLTSTGKKYNDLFEHLMSKTIKEFEASDCDLALFIDWIKPRVPKLLFGSLKDEAKIVYEARVAKQNLTRS